MDDLIIISEDFEKHLKLLETVLKRLQEVEFSTIGNMHIAHAYDLKTVNAHRQQFYPDLHILFMCGHKHLCTVTQSRIQQIDFSVDQGQHLFSLIPTIIRQHRAP